MPFTAVCLKRLLPLPPSTKRLTETSIWMILSASDHGPWAFSTPITGVDRDVMALYNGFKVKDDSTDSCIMSTIAIVVYHYACFHLLWVLLVQFCYLKICIYIDTI